MVFISVGIGFVHVVEGHHVAIAKVPHPLHNLGGGTAGVGKSDGERCTSI